MTDAPRAGTLWRLSLLWLILGALIDSAVEGTGGFGPDAGRAQQLWSFAGVAAVAVGAVGTTWQLTRKRPLVRHHQTPAA